MELVDIVWVMTAAAMVMLMQGGFCLLETGLVRSKNSINVAIKNISDFCVSGALFWMVGFGVMFSQGGALITGSFFFFNDVSDGRLLAFFLFQVVFCGTAATILSGAVAERTRYATYLLCSALTACLIYPVFGRWAWNGVLNGETTGWLNSQGFVDFAGSSVVHSVGGWVALAAVLIIGPRIGRFSRDHPPIQGSNIPFATLGVFLLWFGWFGFNGGSTLKLDDRIPVILINTNLAGMFGGLVGLIISYIHHGFPKVDHVLNGSLAGLVSITAGCFAMTPQNAVIIGSLAGICYYGAAHLMEWLRIDDVVGAVPVHGVCGAWGTIAVALFGDPEILGTGLGFWAQLGIQVKGVLVCFAWAFGSSYVLLKTINHISPLRVSRQHELDGLNISEHQASTEVLDFLHHLQDHEQKGDFGREVPVEPHTEVGQIAAGYNRVIGKVADEMSKNEELLLNILPPEIADRLKAGEETIADTYDEVSIMFVDIVGFTRYSATVAPQELVKMLNEIFSGFDLAVEYRGLEKIKTIGDAYMAVAGLPKPVAKSADTIAHLALDFQKVIRAFNERNEAGIALRIGINTGSVTAGVIGKKKFIYDLWGNAVNVASRMESSGAAGRIQISSSTRNMLTPDDFQLEARGKVDVKGIGAMETWFLSAAVQKQIE